MAEETVHQLTIRFNELVEVAHRRGVGMWAKHHSSDFSSRKVAVEQLQRLQVAMGDPPAPISGPPAPITLHRTLEVTLDLPADDMVIAGPSVNWTSTATLADGREVTHRSVATDWYMAMMLALGHWRKTRAVPPREPVTVTVERK